MKKNLLTVFLLSCAISLQAQYQVNNSGFEQWEAVTYSSYSGDEPLSWNSFLTGTGSLKSMAGRNQLAKSTEVRPGSTGTYSAKINARKVLGSIIAQGNMTTGCINMGSTTATNASGNYNYTNLSVDGQNQPFTGKPDAMHVWVKFYSPTATFRGKINTILHTNGSYQDPEANTITAKVVAKAVNEAVVPTGSWQELTIPFVYNTEVTDRPAYALVSFATNNVAGTGTESDYMNIDDLQYLYYSELASLSYDGTSHFVAGQTSYDLSTVTYDPAKLAVKSNGNGATIEKSYDAATALLTITIKGDNWSVDNTNSHVYTVQFKVPTAEITNYTNPLSIGVNGATSEPQITTIQLVKEVDGSYSFQLNNFMMGVKPNAVPIGNIKLTNLDVNGNNITKTQTITITAGDDPDFDASSWLGPMLGEIPVSLKATLDGSNLIADIDIDMTSSLGQSIKVIFAPEVVIDGTSIPTATGLLNVKLTRSFVKGWNTICLPFDYVLSAFNEANQAEEFTSAENNAANFTKVQSFKANTPYLIYFYDAPTAPIYFGTNMVAASLNDVTYGDVTFRATYEPKSLDQVYRVREDGAAIKGTSSDTAKGTEAFLVSSNPNLFITMDGTPTGVDGIVIDNNQTYDVYNLMGIKVLEKASSLNGLEKGIYIVNGKKVLVK